jgi:shikimate dehydrogenase
MTSTPRRAAIDASTTLYGVLGHPVSHSLSPVMHNAAFRAVGVDACYLAFDVPPEDLETALDGARALGARGLNLTVPLKERALALVEEAEPVAALTGAANTLVPTARGWRAHNTDVEGFLRAVSEDLGFRPKGRRCLLLGAGGAARAAAVALLQEGAQEILLVNRNKERAEALVRELAEKIPGAPLVAAELSSAPDRIGRGDLLVSATPLGLQDQGSWPWELGAFHDGVLAFDMAYRPNAETPLVVTARRAGIRCASGRSMLLYQGARAFALWTGRTAPVDVMAKALGGTPTPR